MTLNVSEREWVAFLSSLDAQQGKIHHLPDHSKELEDLYHLNHK
jgi:hypothetical protein